MIWHIILSILCMHLVIIFYNNRFVQIDNLFSRLTGENLLDYDILTYNQLKNKEYYEMIVSISGAVRMMKLIFRCLITND